MLSTDDLQADHQERLLKSLRNKVSLKDLPKASLKPKTKIKSTYLSGRGSLQDHMMLMKNYICQCGNQISDVSHSMSSGENGTALDSYNIECDNCGDKEQVNFMTMRKTLKDATGTMNTIDRSNKRLFPYV